MKDTRQSQYMKTRVLYYLRYNKQFSYTALEVNTALGSFNSGRQSDVVGLDKHGQVTNIEVKVSISDLKNDLHKDIHYLLQRDFTHTEPKQTFRKWQKVRRWEEIYRPRGKDNTSPVTYFWFAVPSTIRIEAEKICKEKYPYAGLMIISNTSSCYPYKDRVWEVIRPHRFVREKVKEERLNRLAREMSATLCRLMIEKTKDYVL